ncbi:MAG: bifunctional glutamate N-acetyltransferase/amino-acid acetyltransferase ArgJ [Candidatus Omnitrophica bacterium]|nr:bifunctional glutamate N-acetyltransferase/amino-acid acetyltransferase ArgJ [Candidatus Omnitrophota bacterium]
MEIFKKAILPKGFLAAGVASGIKRSGKPDLALFFSEVPAQAACLFTSNKIQAAPLIFCKASLKKSPVHQAIIVNSGNANCFTGKKGLADAEETAGLLAAQTGISKARVLVASTGIIGRPLPMEKIRAGIPLLVSGLSTGGITRAKSAILTTDKVSKEITVRYKQAGKTITVCGVAKGSGMIAPDLATMLSFVFTDAFISGYILRKAVRAAAESSFNCISVDGCMSTNDTLAVMANGEAFASRIVSGRDYNAFLWALSYVCRHLAISLVKDGEGASKFIRIKVGGGKNYAQAKKAALAVANSNLFKTAVYGENPNFGRIAAAVGGCGIELNPEKLKVKLGPLHQKEVLVDVELGAGKAAAVVYTSDLTPEYIKINAEYN